MAKGEGEWRNSKFEIRNNDEIRMTKGEGGCADCGGGEEWARGRWGEWGRGGWVGLVGKMLEGGSGGGRLWGVFLVGELGVLCVGVGVLVGMVWGGGGGAGGGGGGVNCVWNLGHGGGGRGMYGGEYGGFPGVVMKGNWRAGEVVCWP